jgi:hypothetical protein
MYCSFRIGGDEGTYWNSIPVQLRLFVVKLDDTAHRGKTISAGEMGQSAIAGVC